MARDVEKQRLNPMDPIRRREKLAVRPSPGARLDFVVTLEGGLPSGTGRPLPAGAGDVQPLSVVLRYVADRHVLDPASFSGYLAALGGLDWKTLEAVAVAVLDDVNNEVVPRWVQVAVSYENADAGERERHAVLIEDRQPGWDNPSLLARLPRL